LAVASSSHVLVAFPIAFVFNLFLDRLIAGFTMARGES
jgi:hypothetical protein